jgi:Domain of unknown function (DUF5615)
VIFASPRALGSSNVSPEKKWSGQSTMIEHSRISLAPDVLLGKPVIRGYSRTQPEMRFLANENFPGAAVTALEAAGHDVVWVRIAAPGTTDPDVLAWAAREERILLTLDKDFGELARGSALPHTCGIVLLRTPMSRPMSDSGWPT